MLVIDLFENDSNEPELIKALRDFLPIAVKFLKLTHIPKIHLTKELHDTHVPTFGRFENAAREISVVVANRNPVDIIRTLAHELAHYAQGERGELDADSWHTGSSAEDQAHEQAGVMMREFDKKFPQYLSSNPVMLPENFADGKKPGRKGLAKRSGVNCKQSVTKLRSIAKNSSGEKQRMAHWCANMKSGRQK